MANEVDVVGITNAAKRYSGIWAFQMHKQIVKPFCTLHPGNQA